MTIVIIVIFFILSVMRLIFISVVRAKTLNVYCSSSRTGKTLFCWM